MNATASAVNSQIVDSVALAHQFTHGAAASQTLGSLHLVTAHTLALSMHNAIAAQQRSQMQQEAATAVTCAQLLALARTVTGPAAPVSPGDT